MLFTSETRALCLRFLVTLAVSLCGEKAAQAAATTPSQVVGFGTAAVNGTGVVTNVSFSLSGPAAAPTASLAGVDFSASALTCNSGFTICSSNVTFLPLSAGLRVDALVLKNASGVVQAAAYLYGTGTGPLARLMPARIATFSGNGVWAYQDSTTSTSASYRNPQGLAADALGNIYVADSVNQVIRKIAASNGAVTTVAGNGTAARSGDGGPALLASLNTPAGVAVDSAGNLFIADQGNAVIRRVDAASGIITTAAGGGATATGSDGYGDGLTASGAILAGCGNVAVDYAGNLFIADSFHNLVRKVTAATGIISVVAGGGSAAGSDGYGDGLVATSASLSNPTGIAVDASGNIYISDSGHSMVRMVSAGSGIISAFAGTGSYGYQGDGSVATAASLGSPAGLRLDAAGNLYVADLANNAVRVVNASTGIISTLAGNGTAGYAGDNGNSMLASLNNPSDVVFDGAGNLLICDYSNNVIRRVSFSPPTFTFPATNVAITSPLSILTLANFGNAALNLASIAVSAGFALKPSGGTDCAAATALASGAACQLAIAFIPTAAGAVTGTLTIGDNSLNRSSATQTANLAGTGVSGTPAAGLNATSLTFASQAVGTASATQTVTLSNGGTAALNISNLLIGGSNASDFTFTTTCQTTLATSASCTITVTFKPLLAGTRTASLSITDTAQSSPQTLTLTGTGVGGALPSLNVALLQFGSQVVTTAATAQTVTLSNSGTSALSIYGLSLSGANAADFWLTGTTCVSTLAASASCTVSVQFIPTAAGARGAALLINNSSGNSSLSAALLGTGVMPALSVSPAVPTFPPEAVGASSGPVLITVANAVNYTISIASIVVSGTNAADFSLSSNSCPAALTANSCTLGITFTAQATGARTASLTITSNGSVSSITVPLSGSGIIAAAAPSLVATTGGYNITTLSVPGAASTNPAAINKSGQIAGSYQDPSGIHGFVYQSGAFTKIDCANVQATAASAISDSGIVYGSCGSNIFQYVSSTGQLTTAPIQVPAGSTLSPLPAITAISATGQVFGSLSTASGYRPFQYLYPSGPAAFIAGLAASTAYSPAITGANPGGELAGNTNGAFSYLDGVYSLIPQLSTVTGVGPSGQLLGVINQAGAVYQNGSIALLQLPGTIGSAPTPAAINASGYLVGTFTLAGSGLTQGFLGTPITAASTEKSSVHIDSPNPSSGVLFGNYQISGWTIDNTSSNDAVNILVDGALLATTTTTLARPDVCAIFPGQSGCPNVGWQYVLDTSNLADGMHTLEVLAISNTGQRATTTVAITVGNGAQTVSPLKLAIDSPAAQTAVSGPLIISGWAEDPGSYISSIGISIDLTVRSAANFSNQSAATTGMYRPDVCSVFSGDLHCPNVGWTYTLNSNSLSNGPHTLTVVAYAANGDQTIVTRTFTVVNYGALKFNLDQPSANATLSGQTPISGWAFDAYSHIATIGMVIDGLLTTPYLNFGRARADVCAALPGGLDCPNVGWSGSLNTTLLANGAHTLSIVATAQNGDSFNSQPISFVVNNPSTGNTTHANIDTSSASGQQFWGEATFSGWALDDSTPIQSLDFLVDGNPAAAGGYTITARPDVCAAYPNRPNCPNVGWVYSLNTFALANGAHTLTLIAISQTNSRATAAVTFTVNNQVGQAGTRLFIDSPAAASAPLSGQITVSGWTLSAYYNISSVNASIDGGAPLSATYHFARPDVCQFYPDAPDCPNVGWSFGLDTTQLADGVHRLKVTASTPQYNGLGSVPEATQSVFFTVANTGVSTPIASYIDTPTAATPTLSGVTSFSGWAIDQNAIIANIEITVDGSPFGLAAYGSSRPDVCSGFPQYAGCPAGAVGWSFAIDTTALVNGSHMLAVTAASTDGKYHTITSTFSTAN